VDDVEKAVKDFPMILSLPERPQVDRKTLALICDDFEKFRHAPLPKDWETYVRERYRIDLTTRYGGKVIKNPFGKASGQLSHQLHQVKADSEAGLGFCVLKTVIAQNAEGSQSMKAWAIPVTRMQVEPIQGKDGTWGWTVSWKGRGWSGTFEEYLKFTEKSLAVGREHNMLVVPSVKYHLPAPGEETWRVDEYEYTTQALYRVWRQQGDDPQMPLEKDFSPTLAGSDLAAQKEKILEWLRKTPKLIKSSLPAGAVAVGVKVFNTMFEDEFQLTMLKTLIDEAEDGIGADFLIYANRLFDPQREFDGKVGIAYGGPDLSARNLKVLRLLREREQAGAFQNPVPPISATGDVSTGKMALRYLLCGCENFQMHTLFQLPRQCFPKKNGSRIEKALHKLLFDPEDGFLVWLIHGRIHHGWADKDGVTRLQTLPALYSRIAKNLLAK
jgi:dihydroorotate dehydrogenase